MIGSLMENSEIPAGSKILFVDDEISKGYTAKASFSVILDATLDDHMLLMKSSSCAECFARAL